MSCVPNVLSVPSVLSKVYCFFIVFVLCRVRPMLSVSLLFCLRFIVFFIVFVLCRVCPMLLVSFLFCLRFIVFFYCLRPVSCAPNVVSVPSVLS